MSKRLFLGVAAVVAATALLPGREQDADPLPSWNEGPAKKAILAFVAKVAKKGGPDFVPIAERVATFDNDGTLWTEQPMYVQAMFVLDRIKALAAKHPEWKDRQPFKAVLEGDREALAKIGEKGFMELAAVVHDGVTTEEFDETARAWLATAKHPRFKRLYTELVYQPMLELLTFLRANQFKTFIVSGGGIEFMRVFTERVYGVPPEQVIGSSLVTKFSERDGKFVLVQEPKIFFINDRLGKPEAIHRHIGRRPIAAFGNSDGDLQMLQWTTGGAGARFGLIVHHTDAEREYAYDRKSPIGRLDKALDQASKHGWTVVDMKKDWKVIYPPSR